MAKCTKRRRFSLLRQLRRRQAARAAIGMESLEPRAMLTTLYWDPNGATPGLGGSGTWDLLSANWTTDPTGSSPTIACDLPPLNEATPGARILGGRNQGRARNATRKGGAGGGHHPQAPRG